MVDYFSRVRGGEGCEGGFEGGVGGGDGGAEGGEVGGVGEGEEVGPERGEVFGVEVRDQDVGGSRVEEAADETGDLGRDVLGEVGVAGRVVVRGDGAVVRGVHVVGADPEGVQRVLVDAAGDVVCDLDLGARGAPAWGGEFAVGEPGAVVDGGAEVCFLESALYLLGL